MDRFVGKRLDGRYEIREILGVGGMAVVYKAYDNVEDRIVAIKILKEEYATNEEFLRRFKNESKAISLLSHPNIVKIYDVSFGDIIQYIVMEYIEGITLKEHIEQEGCLSWKDAVYYTIQILRGLQHAHDRGIVHRDVKPQNIMLLPDGTIKVTDFGIARFARSEQKTITDKAIGSVHYISPEQARGEATDEKADIYSVGVILYEMLTGKLPFEAESAVSVAIMQLQREPKLPTEINGSIPLGVEQITLHAMQKSTVNRYKSSSEMLCDLEKFKKDPSTTFDFTYFVDDSPTRFVDIENEEDEFGEEKEKGSIIPILAGVAATFFLAVVAVFFIFFLPKFTGSTGAEIKCPTFVGQSYESLNNDENINEQFEITFKWYPNSQYPYGVVFQQSQPANKNVKKGAAIELSVSMGVETKTVPEVRGYSENSARKTLELQGFTVKVEQKADEEIASGLAVNTYPAAGSSVVDGTEVTLYISSGAPTVYVPLPNVVTLSYEDAKSIIEKAGLSCRKETVENANGENVPEGVVKAQSPAYSSGKEVGKGTEVVLKVSNGVTKYTADVKIDLPEGTKSAALFINGSAAKEVNNIKEGSTSCTFAGITANKKTIDAVVKIKTAEITDYTEYLEITVNLSNNGKITVNKTYTIGE